MPDVQPTVPEEAVEAAARADYENWLGHSRRCWDAASDYDQNQWLERFHIALAAAVPVIEKQLRARLADEIEAFGAMQQELAANGIVQAAATVSQVWRAAARIVRGEQP